jgi:hypothetical protein
MVFGFFKTRRKRRKRQKGRKINKTKKKKITKKINKQDKKSEDKKYEDKKYIRKKFKISKLYKTRKITDTSFPYLPISKAQAIDEFLRMKNCNNLNPKSLIGNKMVNYGTYRQRVKTKYRGRSWYELWKNPVRRKKLNEFVRRLVKTKHVGDVLRAQRDAISLQWGTINTMRPAAALTFYRKYNATSVLDFTAGWGARMVAAIAAEINYIGIDSNKSLKPGYDKILDALKPFNKSKVKLHFKKAEEIDFSKLGYYDLVFTSPPYEYLEVYEHMKNYENVGSKIKQPSSSTKIKKDDSSKFYDEFIIPTIKSAFKYLPKGKWLCLNIPDLMYKKIKSRWKKCTKKEIYTIVRRQGSTMGVTGRRGMEYIYCWQK